MRNPLLACAPSARLPARGARKQGARRPDYGRLIMIPTALGFVVLDGAALVRGSGTDPLHWVSTGLVCAFYALIVWCYLRRGPASATSRSVTAHAAAVTAMLVPFAFPLLRSAPPGGAQQWGGDALVAGGTALAVWSLRSLGRSVSVLAGTLPALAVWLGFCFLQAYRALREEQLLLAAMPAYRGYRARTAALVPGLFLPAPARQPSLSPSRRAAFHFRIFGRTSGLIGSASKSASQRSGVISG